MKIKTTLLIVILTIQFTTAQNFQTVEEVDNSCGVLGFSSNEEAQLIVDEILDKKDLFRNFILQECPDINNAVAKILTSDAGTKERFILYDGEFFNRIEQKAGNKWASISILAHEIGHHLNGHSLSNKGSTHKFELEADYFSGSVLAEMGATLDETQSAIQTLKYEKATSTHPAKSDRLAIIEKGWNKAKGITKTKTSEEERIEKANEFYVKGELAYKIYDFVSAIDNFNESIKFGNIDAYFYLSNCYYNGLGVIIDEDEAVRLAKKGYESGSIPTTYLYAEYLAFMLDNYDDAERLFKKDFQAKWFRNQFQKNKTPVFAGTIAYMLREGYGGFEQNEEKSVFWFKEAAALGDFTAMHLLGDMYETGRAVEQDSKQALYWFKKAAEKGFSGAQFSYGNVFFNGDVVNQDYKKAFFWYQKSAKQNYGQAKDALALMYENGLGVEKDLEKANYWYNKR